MARSTFTTKPGIGKCAGSASVAIALQKKAVKQVQTANAKKVPVYVAELNMTLYVVPGTDIGPIVEKHREMREWRRKTV